MAQGRLLNIRLFVEGIEIPCTSATVSCGIQQPAQGSFEIPFAVSAKEILPRTLVHLFFFESAYDEVDVAEGKAPAFKQRNSSDPKAWKLLFAGEVVAVQFLKVAGQRANVLMCSDFSSYWSSAQLYWGTGNNSYNAYKKIMFMGATQVASNGKKVQNGGALAELLSASPSSVPGLSGVLGGIVSLLEASTGVYGAGKKYRGVNDFMSQAELRLHLSRMIGAHPSDDSSEMFLQHGDMRSYFRRLTAATQGTSSFMDLVNTYMGKIHHTWSSVLAPPFIDKGASVIVKQEVPVGSKGSSDANMDKWEKIAADNLAEVDGRIKEAQSNPNAHISVDLAYGELPGKSSSNVKEVAASPVTVVQKDKHTSFSAKLKTKGLYEDNKKASSSDSIQGQLSKDSIAAAEEKKKISTQRIHTLKSQALAKLAEAVPEIDKLVQTDTTGNHTNHTMGQLRLVKTKLEEALDLMKRRSRAQTVTKTYRVAADSRINMFMFTPDLYMVPPPKCNVLFPDHYMKIQYGLSWLNEPTRLWLFGQTTAGTETMVGYFAPNSAVLSGPNVSDAAAAVNTGISFLMPHEIYSGPVPVIESLGDMNVFRKIHASNLAAVKKPGDKVADPDGSKVAGQARYSPVEHMQRAANYLFFARRFGARSMSIEARFSPQIVPGLPMLVLDPPTGESTLAGNGLLAEPGQHYVGLVASVSHSISTSGAGTTISLVKCRYHDEGVDLFERDGHKTATRTGTLEYTKKIYRMATVRRKKKPGENLWRVNIPEEGQVTSRKYLDIAANENSPGTGFIEVRVDYAKNRAGDEQRTTVYKNAKSGKEVTVVLRDVTPIGPVYDQGEWLDFHPTFEVIKETTKQKKITAKDLTFTFEGTATPPWFASIYLPTKIGKEYYEVMLGCRSVVDDGLLNAVGLGEEMVRVLVPTAGKPREVDIPAEFTEPAASTHHAAELLADTWKGLQESGANIPLFIETYTSRRYTTLVDILGDSNPYLRQRMLDTSTITGTTEGFHGHAYGDLSGLNKFDGNPLEEEPTVPRLRENKLKLPELRKVSPQADPRSARYQKVSAYLAEIAKIGSNSGGE